MGSPALAHLALCALKSLKRKHRYRSYYDMEQYGGCDSKMMHLGTNVSDDVIVEDPNMLQMVFLFKPILFCPNNS